MRNHILISLGLVVISAVLLGVSYPSLSWWPCAYVGLIPWLIVLKRSRSNREAMWFSLLMAVIWHMICLSWLGSLGTLPVVGGWLAVLALTLFVTSSYAILGLMVREILNRGSIRLSLLLIPTVWIGFDFIKLFGGWAFPWLYLGYSQTPFLLGIQTAEIGGPFAPTWLIVFINCLLYLPFLDSVKKHRLWLLEVGVTVVLFTLGFGWLRMNLPFYTVENWRISKLPEKFIGNTLNVGVTQGGISSLVEWNSSFEELTAKTYLQATVDAINDGKSKNTWPDVILFPETSFAGMMYLPNLNQLDLRLMQLIRTNDVYIIIPKVTKLIVSKKESVIDNSALAISPEWTLTGRYTKQQIVPFGECLPLAGIMRFLDFPWGDEDFARSPLFEPLVIQSRDKRTVRVGSMICFDSIWPWVAQRHTQKGAQFLAVLTNNSWYTNRSGILQHDVVDIFRAIENRRFLVRSSTTGISHTISPEGNTVRSTNLNEKTGYTVQIEYGNPRREFTTLYTRFGNWMGALALTFTIATAVYFGIVGRSEPID